MADGDHCSRLHEVLTVVDLGVSNIGSLVSALRFLGADFVVASDVAGVRSATAMLLPGVGAFDPAVAAIDDAGIRGPLRERVESGMPLLGVCLGMQLLFEGSDEGERAGLGLLPGHVERLGLSTDSKVPHVGFARVTAPSDSWLSRALGANPDFYFTHSFAVRQPVCDAAVGTCAYDDGFVAAVERWPVVGVQFHPEKSQASGLKFLLEFLLRIDQR